MLTWPSFWDQHFLEGKGSQGRSLLQCRLLEYPSHPGNYYTKYYFKKTCINVLNVLNIDLQFVWSTPRSVRLSFQWLNPYYQLTEPDNSSITCTGPPDAALRQKCQSRTILTPGQRGVIRGWRAPRKTTTHVIWPMTVAIICENIWLKIMLYAQNVIGFCPCSVSFLKLYPDRDMNIVQENMSSSFSVA